MFSAQRGALCHQSKCNRSSRQGNDISVAEVTAPLLMVRLVLLLQSRVQRAPRISARGRQNRLGARRRFRAPSSTCTASVSDA